MTKSDAQRNKMHLKKYEKQIQPMYEEIHNKLNKYILSFKSNDDKKAADCHSLFNLFVFAFARLRLFAQQTPDEKFTYNDFLDRVFIKGVEMGEQDIKLNGSFND